jgi:hypothetical protein
VPRIPAYERDISRRGFTRDRGQLATKRTEGRSETEAEGEAARLFRAMDLAAVGYAPFRWSGYEVRAGRFVAWRDGPALVTGATTPLNGQSIADHGRLGLRLTSGPAEGTAVGNLEAQPIRQSPAILAQQLRGKLLHL